MSLLEKYFIEYKEYSPIFFILLGVIYGYYLIKENIDDEKYNISISTKMHGWGIVIIFIMIGILLMMKIWFKIKF